ncbi:MAG: hypothetical protein FWH10_07090, partial [Oscillospiraceae bacterium]|nr:hypothetical protein [Oscillospiraceae bacterium]
IADGSAMGDSLYKVLVYEGGELKDSIKAYGGAGFDGHLVRVTTTEKDFLGDVRSQVVSIDNVASRIAKTESQVVNTGLDEVLTMTRGRVVSLENETSIVVETDKYFTLDGIKQYRKVNLSGTKIGDNYDWNVHGFNGAAVSGMNLYAVVYSETSTGKVISVTLALDTGAIEIEVESITKETETTLEITFDDDAFVLASEDIKFSGAGSATVVSVANDGDGVWTVTINVTTAGAVTVSIAKPGFVFEQWTENIVLTMV